MKQKFYNDGSGGSASIRRVRGGYRVSLRQSAASNKTYKTLEGARLALFRLRGAACLGL